MITLPTTARCNSVKTTKWISSIKIHVIAAFVVHELLLAVKGLFLLHQAHRDRLIGRYLRIIPNCALRILLWLLSTSYTRMEGRESSTHEFPLILLLLVNLHLRMATSSIQTACSLPELHRCLRLPHHLCCLLHTTVEGCLCILRSAWISSDVLRLEGVWLLSGLLLVQLWCLWGI